MEEEAHTKIEYRVRDLPTRSVTLFPSRAQVVREIKDVALKPGNNEITVVGLTPTIDEHSIKVEGTGSHAVITNIAVELLPNHVLFQDIYPDSDEDDDKDDESEKEDQDEGDDHYKTEKKKTEDSLEAVCEKLVAMRDDQHRFKEAIANATSRLKLLDAFGETLRHKECKITIQEGLATYREEREKVFSDHMDATVRERRIAKEISDLTKEESRLKEIRRKQHDRLTKSKRKAAEAKQKEKKKEEFRRAEKRKEKDRIRKEREQFWPRSCYTVRITLDSAVLTPSSSRRTSIASASDLVKEPPSSHDHDDVVACDLTLSYVTNSAFWSPSYDLALSTTTNTARLCFDASLTNMTSEVWSNCKVILSNSQTNFSLFNNAIPILKPWHVKMGGKNAASASGVLDSREERAEKQGWHANQNAVALKPRANLFGVGQPGHEPFAPRHVQYKASNPGQAPIVVQQPAQAPVRAGGLFGSTAPSHAQTAFGSAAPYQTQGPGLFGQATATTANTNSGALFGSSVAPPPPAPATSHPLGGSSFGGGDYSNSNSNATAVFSNPSVNETNHGPSWTHLGQNEDVDGATILEPAPELSFQESSFEETGLTTTYDLPSFKTLRPSSTASKQRVAHVSFTNVIFSRTVIAKYTPVAYLKAKLRNSSKLSLIRGPAGLTLDGTFMGRLTLPRCSAGDSFSLSLGVDPGIMVAYPKPEVKRSTSGLFTKEDSSVYTRTITLLNTRAASAKHVNITVLDQVPVSEDEKLRVTTLHPRGLTVGGTAVMTGVGGGQGDKEWGRATAALKKGGEVAWDVALNAGRSVKLTLEYEVALPTGEFVTQC